MNRKAINDDELRKLQEESRLNAQREIVLAMKNATTQSNREETPLPF